MNKIEELYEQKWRAEYKLMKAKLEELIKIHREKGIKKMIKAGETEGYEVYMFGLDELDELRELLRCNDKDYEYTRAPAFGIEVDSRRFCNENRWRICSNTCI